MARNSSTSSRMHDDAIEIDTRCRGRTPKVAVALLASVTLAVAEPIPLPEVKDPALEVTLIAAEPDIVTPVGCAVDAKGRLFVVESHTHFPPANYAGPKTDRIKIFEDTDGGGKPDKITVFAEDLKWTMNIAFAPDGSLYVVHRNGVIRMTEKDGKCDKRTDLVTMETKGDYPHNGLSGIAFGPHDTMFLGMGENLGMPYTVRG